MLNFFIFLFYYLKNNYSLKLRRRKTCKIIIELFQYLILFQSIVMEKFPLKILLILYLIQMIIFIHYTIPLIIKKIKIFNNYHISLKILLSAKNILYMKKKTKGNSFMKIVKDLFRIYRMFYLNKILVRKVKEFQKTKKKNDKKKYKHKKTNKQNVKNKYNL